MKLIDLENGQCCPCWIALITDSIHNCFSLLMVLVRDSIQLTVTMVTLFFQMAYQITDIENLYYKKLFVSRWSWNGSTKCACLLMKVYRSAPWEPMEGASVNIMVSQWVGWKHSLLSLSLSSSHSLASSFSLSLSLPHSIHLSISISLYLYSHSLSFYLSI